MSHLLEMASVRLVNEARALPAYMPPYILGAVPHPVVTWFTDPSSVKLHFAFRVLRFALGGSIGVVTFCCAIIVCFCGLRFALCVSRFAFRVCVLGQ